MHNSMDGKKLCVFFLLSIISMANCEANKPSRYIWERGRVFMYQATRFVATIPERLGERQYSFVSTVNGVFSTRIILNLEQSGDINKITNGIIWGEDLDDYAFATVIHFRVELSDFQTSQLIDSINIRLQLTKGIPSEVTNITGRNGMIDADFKFLVRCDRFTGINCFLPLSATKDFALGINHFTGERFCRNGKVDPPVCLQDAQSSVTVGDCLNGGVFIEAAVFGGYCDCPDGFRGEKCEKFKCDLMCVNPNGQCTGPNTCTCSPGFIGPSCQILSCDNLVDCGNGECSILTGRPLCVCSEGFFGDRCQHTCDPACENGICLLSDEETTLCQCEDGFQGDSCERSVSNNQAFSDSSQRNSTSTGILIGTLVITTAICLLSILIQFDWGRGIKKKLFKDLFIQAGQNFSQSEVGLIGQPSIPIPKPEETDQEDDDDEESELFDEIEVVYDDLEAV